MDIDHFIARHQPSWDRLEALVGRAGTGAGLGGIAGAELDELVVLYQRTSTHLSQARTTYRDPALTGRLSQLVSRAGSVVYGTRPRSWRAFGQFARVTFPAAVWSGRRFVAVAALLLLVPAIAIGVWLGLSDRAVEATASEAARQAYVEDDFEDYYSSQPAVDFASQVFTNNVRVGILAFAAGILLCVPAALILAFNGANLGVAGGLFADAGELGRFFGLILPHGLLELTAVAIAGGAGLRLGWSIVSPGDRPRAEALAEEGRRSVTVVLGLVGAFLAAGLVEGFVTGRPWPTAVRVGIGVVVWAAFGLYVWHWGRVAEAAGYRGILGEGDDAGWARHARG